MAENEIHTIATQSGREPPGGTGVKVANAGIPGFVRLSLLLPGQSAWVDLGLLPIKDGTIRFPLPLAFLCHASQDEEKVREIGNRLQQDGILVWFAPNALKGGSEWAAEIEKAMRECDFVIIFLSVAAINKTGFVQREVKYAFEQLQLRPDNARYVIPVLLEPCQPPARFEHFHWIKLFENDGYTRLKASVR